MYALRRAVEEREGGRTKGGGWEAEGRDLHGLKAFLALDCVGLCCQLGRLIGVGGSLLGLLFGCHLVERGHLCMLRERRSAESRIIGMN